MRASKAGHLTGGKQVTGKQVLIEVQQEPDLMGVILTIPNPRKKKESQDPRFTHPKSLSLNSQHGS